ncbi:4Fe-4S dicluster domain-containing protein [Helicobacter vulpis]|uniref:4Fe-4S dicluster domain-containing protein n=1 Tax=Helicobacter vulpis TaxID=2316076 RepID=UPI000EAD646F|nr:4Fe-4S dicluster domain-containing protein [Helicobacter vulpis]
MLEFLYIKSPQCPNLPLHDHIEVLDRVDSSLECVVSNVPLQGAKRVGREINFLLENSAQSPLELAQSLSLLYEVHGLQFDFDSTKHTPTPEGTFSEFFSYNKEICQYHQRRVECCGKCSEVCPTQAITKLDPQIALDQGLECEDNRHLLIKHQACIDCGQCISVCPSGSLSYASFSLECMQEVAKLYRGYIPLLLDHKADLPLTPLKKEVLPLCVNLNILEQVALLTLLQESGSQIVLYAPQDLGVGTLESIALLNGIYAQLYQEEAILLASDLASLQACLQRAKCLESTHFTPPTIPARTKRDLFAQRLQHAIGQGDYGRVPSASFIRYGHIEINSNCTLCLSCVGACNTNALSIDGNTYTLLFNPSLCTTCGYCEATCPEKDCLHLERDGIALNPSYFTPKIMAQDSLFGCKMCGKPIGTTKSVQKIAQMMIPRFQGDARRIATLYACPDCKVKIMLEDMLDINSIFK